MLNELEYQSQQTGVSSEKPLRNRLRLSARLHRKPE